jgi:hypothetical protein
MFLRNAGILPASTHGVTIQKTNSGTFIKVNCLESHLEKHIYKKTHGPDDTINYT